MWYLDVYLIVVSPIIYSVFYMVRGCKCKWMYFTFNQFQCFALFRLILDHWTMASFTFAAVWLKSVLVIHPFSDSYHFRVRNCVSYSDRVENNYAFFLFICVVCGYALSILRFNLCVTVLFALKLCSCSNFSAWCYCLVVQECYIAFTCLIFLKCILVIIDLSYLPSPLLFDLAVARGLRPANGILRYRWTLRLFLMQWSRSIWIMLVIW